MSLIEYMDEIWGLIHESMHDLSAEEYEEFAEYTAECLAGQR